MVCYNPSKLKLLQKLTQPLGWGESTRIRALIFVVCVKSMLVCALREICVPPPTPAPWKTSWTPAALCEQPWVRLQQGQIMQIKQLVWQHWFINYSNRVCCWSIQCTQKLLTRNHLIRTALLFACPFPQLKPPWRHNWKYRWFDFSWVCGFIMCVDDFCFV